MQKLLTLSSLILASAITMSCGSEGPSAKVEMTTIPERPMVVNAGYTVPDSNASDDFDDSFEVEAPWIKFKLKVENKSDKYYLVINAFEIEIENDKGKVEKYGFSAGELTNSPQSFYILEPGETRIMDDWADGSPSPPDVSFLMDAFPENSRESNFNYRFTIKPSGWFTEVGSVANKLESLDVFSERFSRKFRFRTQ